MTSELAAGYSPRNSKTAQRPECDASQRLFHHTPLDLKSNSLRLIRILPSTYDGEIIKCQIEVGTTDSEYVCLSYVWGLQNSADWILIDGKRHQVRQNLWDFLHWARQTHIANNSLLWIDALCIDQFDHIEKAHQVQQMGSIFSSAREVVSWFGTDPDIARFLEECRTCQSRPWSDPLRLPMVCSALPDSPYWRRAWITQEFTLPRKIMLMARGSMCSEFDIPYLVRGDNAAYSQFLERLATLRAHRRTPSGQDDRLQGRSLISLLYRFQSMACRTSLDRAFSLLALCGEGSDLRVDYEISATQLVCNIVNCCSQSACVCCIAIISRVLGVTPQKVHTMQDSSNIIDEFLVEFNIPAHRFAVAIPERIRDKIGIPPGSSMSGSSSSARQSDYWCRLHGHDEKALRLTTSYCSALYFSLNISLDSRCSNQRIKFSIHDDWGFGYGNDALTMRRSECGLLWKFQMSLNTWLLTHEDGQDVCRHVSQHQHNLGGTDRNRIPIPRVSIVQIYEGAGFE